MNLSPLRTIAAGACALGLFLNTAVMAAEEAPAQADNAAPAVEQPPARKTVVLPRRVGKVDVSEAARRLEQAQLARKQGLEPRPGEFTRIGGVRQMNYRYWQRQEKLRVAVEVAQRRSLSTASRYGNVVKVSHRFDSL